MKKILCITLTILSLCCFTSTAKAQQATDAQQATAQKTEGKEALGVGDIVPDFTFTDHQTGEKMSLYDVCKKNKYVLVDFWASWCNPCRKEIPHFKTMYQIYKSRGFQIVSISADAKQADWLKALEEEKLPWPNDIDGNQGICKLYNVQFYPTLYLLDKDARVVICNDDARGQRLRAKLGELFVQAAEKSGE